MPRDSTRASDVLLLAVLAGILGGLAEAARAVWRQRILYFPTGEFVSAEVWWMTPLAATTGLVLLALGLIAVDRATGGRWKLLRLGPPAFAGLAAYSFLRASGLGIAPIAILLLALGIAAVTARFLDAWPALVRRITRVAAPALALALLVWAAAVPTVRRVSAHRSLAALPPPAADVPNVLVIIWDSVRALSLSLHGYARETTPELERFAAQGTVFERAFATAPWSLPSHASLFTGRWPTELNAARQAPLDATFPTLAEVLAEQGYATAGLTANIYYGSRAFGIARGFSWYDERPPINPRVVASTWWLSRTLLWQLRDRATENAPSAMRPRAHHINAALLRWIDRRPADRPFFAVINQFDAHDPYFPPEPFLSAFSEGRPRFWLSEEHRAYDEATLAQLRDAYDGAIRYLDHQLGLLLESLRARNLLENTLVIVTSDHGEEFGEHGPTLVKHARSLYAPVLHVPLVLVHPELVPAGVRRREAVSIRDVPATVMDALGLAAASPFPGTSLLQYARGSAGEHATPRPQLSVAEASPMGGVLDSWPIAAGDMFSLVWEDLHYIVDGAGREQLFDLSADPMELNDLAGSPGAAGQLDRFRAALDSVVGKPHRERPAYRGAEGKSVREE